MFLRSKLAAGTVAGILSLTFTGAVALAAFHPAPPAAAPSFHADGSIATVLERGEKGGKGLEKLEAVLDRLVTAGSITAEQRDTILQAMRSSVDQRHGQLKRIWADLMRLSLEYLGLPKDELRVALRSGTSLGELADETTGKSRDDLIGFLVAEATAVIDQALADGKITEEHADDATIRLEERVTKFVDHVYAKRPGVERAKERFEGLKERLKDQLKGLKERAKERREGFRDED